MRTVLICDDEKDIVSALNIYLSAEGYHTLLAYNGREAVALAKANEVHLALLDVMMPELNGIAAVAALRAIGNFPIILLTAKSEDSDKVLGLTVGADDYVTKPFNPVELLARVKSQLRRYTVLGGMPEEGKALSLCGVSLDDDKKAVTRDGEPIALTPTEYGILRLLMQNPNRVYSSKQIYESVWNDPSLGAESTVAVHIRHLREKLEINPEAPRFLKVVWGHGYKFETEN